MPQVRRATRTRPTPRPPRGLVTQLRVSRRSHPPSLSRDRMSRLLVVVPTRHESRLKGKENFFVIVTRACTYYVVIKINKHKKSTCLYSIALTEATSGKKVLQQSLQCLLVHARAVFPEILPALLAPGTLSRLGLHGLSIFPIIGGLSGSLLLAMGRSPRASLFPQPLPVLLSLPSLSHPHFLFILHPLLSFSPIHLVSILEVPRLLLVSHSLPIVLVPAPPPLSLALLLHRQNKQTTSRRLAFFLVTPGVLGPLDPRTEQGSGPQSPQGGLPHGHQRASRPLDLAQFPTSGQDGLPVRRIPDSRPLVDLGPILLPMAAIALEHLPVICSVRPHPGLSSLPRSQPLLPHPLLFLRLAHPLRLPLPPSLLLSKHKQHPFSSTFISSSSSAALVFHINTSFLPSHTSF